MRYQVARKALLVFALACVLFALMAPAALAWSQCQFCHLASDGWGYCYDVIGDPGFSMQTYSNCLGGQMCFPFLGGRFCRPQCFGDMCYYV